MLDEALVALAAAGGTAVVQAAGTEAWVGLRQAVARWFSRGDERSERAALERLDQTADELESAEEDVAESTRIRQEAAWQARIEVLLEGLDGTERVRALGELRALLDQHTHQAWKLAGVVPAVSGEVTIHAEGGSIAGGVIHGGAHINHPPMPDPPQG